MITKQKFKKVKIRVRARNGQGKRILQHLAKYPLRCGDDLARVLGIKFGSIYVILERLQVAGLIEYVLEMIPRQFIGRVVPKKFYRLTSAGKKES